MSAFGAIVMMIPLIEWSVGIGDGHSADHFFFFGMPFFASCIVADAGMAAGFAGISRMTEAGEDAIVKARLHWRNSQN